MAKTVNMMVRPGKDTNHQASRKKERAAPTIKPQLIWLGAPKPKKDSALSTRMAVATIKEPVTIKGERVFGKTCRSKMALSVCPATTAA
jgi:hypothetical protein